MINTKWKMWNFVQEHRKLTATCIGLAVHMAARTTNRPLSVNRVITLKTIIIPTILIRPFHSSVLPACPAGRPPARQPTSRPASVPACLPVYLYYTHHTPTDTPTNLKQNKKFEAPVIKPRFILQKFRNVRVHLWVLLFVSYFNFMKNLRIKHTCRSVYVQCFRILYNLEVSRRRHLFFLNHWHYFASNVWLYLWSISVPNFTCVGAKINWLSTSEWTPKKVSAWLQYCYLKYRKEFVLSYTTTV
jgi:hypothetical protein